MNSPAAPPHRFSSAANAVAECDTLLVSFIEEVCKRLGRPTIVGLSGPQGSGKSTTAHRLASQLEGRGLAVIVLSLDDFYHPRAKRLELARKIHPLLVTRGVPGTHDLNLANDCLTQLSDPTASAPVFVPVFDKLADDRCDWRSVSTPVQILLLEGWCIGVPPQPRKDLEQPVNALEREEDPEGCWRRFVNSQLEGPYRDLFCRLDALVAFRAPFFDIIEAWRAEQEAKMAAVTGHSPSMTAADIRRFVSHFERLTRWMDNCPTADVLIDLDELRRPLEYRCLLRNRNGG